MGKGGLSQVECFPWENPLRERIDAAFFRSLPKAPGVYLMRDDSGVIYVGKSVNLRARVSSYKYAKPGNASRKVLRMVSHIRQIAIETLPDERTALLRENELIRQHRPRFNAASKHPEANAFIGIQPEAGGFQIRWTREALTERGIAGFRWYGAFRSYRTVAVLGALRRLCWMHTGGRLVTTADLPVALNPMRRLPTIFSIPLAGSNRSQEARMTRKLEEFLAGTGDSLIGRLCGNEGSTIRRFAAHPCIRQQLMLDRQALIDFFLLASSRNHFYKARINHATGWVIRQDSLDDLAVCHRFHQPSLF